MQSAGWNWNGYEGKPVKVEVYAVADEVELLINGQSVERKKVGETKKYITIFRHPHIMPEK